MHVDISKYTSDRRKKSECRKKNRHRASRSNVHSSEMIGAHTCTCRAKLHPKNKYGNFDTEKMNVISTIQECPEYTDFFILLRVT